MYPLRMRGILFIFPFTYTTTPTDNKKIKCFEFARIGRPFDETVKFVFSRFIVCLNSKTKGKLGKRTNGRQTEGEKEGEEKEGKGR